MKAPSTRTRLLYLLLTGLSTVANAWVQPSSLLLQNKRATRSLTPRPALESLVEPMQTLQSTLLDNHHAAGALADGWSSLVTAASTATLQVGGHGLTLNTLQPAHEHVEGWFGASDPYLAAGHSIAPSAKALENLGIERTGDLPDRLNQVLSQGWKLLDARTIQQQTVLPGFSPPSGILPTHSAPPETPESLAASVEWSARYLKVVDKLPEAALAYALVEFFLLRPNIDLYKEEIRQEPGAVALETAVTVGVRVAALSVVGAVTLGIFG